MTQQRRAPMPTFDNAIRFSSLRLPGVNDGVMFTIPSGWSVWTLAGVRYERADDGTIAAIDGGRVYAWSVDRQDWITT